MAETAFKPVRTRQTVQDQVYDQLRQALISGAFEAGQGFTIPSLAKSFGTSHMPVREALRRLAAENALRISPTGTAMVPHLERAELLRIFEARLILEPATAELAFERLNPGVIAVLRDNLERHRAAGQAGEVVEMLALNRAFHFTIYDAADNHVLFDQIENLWLRSGPYVRFLSDRMEGLMTGDYRTAYTAHHEAMLAALASGDKAKFVAQMHADVAASRDLLLGILEPEA